MMMVFNERPSHQAPEQQLIDRALDQLHDYASIKQHVGENPDALDERREGAWDRMLLTIDTFLQRRQEAHLRAVDEAGASGR